MKAPEYVERIEALEASQTAQDAALEAALETALEAASGAAQTADSKVATVNGLAPDSAGNVDVGGMPLGAAFPYTGSDVPAATTVSPTMSSETPSALAMSTAPQTRKCEEPTSRTSPRTVHASGCFTGVISASSCCEPPFLRSRWHEIGSRTANAASERKASSREKTPPHRTRNPENRETPTKSADEESTVNVLVDIGRISATTPRMTAML